MLNYKTIVIYDGMTDEEIAEKIINADVAAVFDGRTGLISKTLDEIVKEYYRKKDERAKEEALAAKSRNPFAPLPISEHRPAEIKIGK
jgi:hypothetical protein